MYVQFSSVLQIRASRFDRRKMDGTITTFFSFCVIVELMEVSSSYRLAIHQNLRIPRTRRPHVHIRNEVVRCLNEQDSEVAKPVDGESGGDGVLDDDENARAAGENQLGELRGNHVPRVIAVQHENHWTAVRTRERKRRLPGPTLLEMGDEEDSRWTADEAREKDKREHGNEGHIHGVDGRKAVFRPADRVGDKSVFVVQEAVRADDVEWNLAANAKC